MTDSLNHSNVSPWQPSPPPPRPQGPGPLIVVLAAIVVLLLLTAGVGAAVVGTESTTTHTASHRLVGPATTSEPSSTLPPSSSTRPAATAPPTTRPGPVAPVSPLSVPPVTAPPVAVHPPPLSTAAIEALVNPSVVDIDTRLAFQHAIAAGTGVILSSNGVVLTNNHVIDGATTIGAVSVASGRTYTAHVIGVDPTADVAVIQLDGASGLRPAPTFSGPALPGDPVVAIGNAGGVGGAPSVTTGTVEATNQSIVASDPAAGTSEQLDGLIETTAVLQPGDSGGPLVNGSGQVIGIDTAAALTTESATSVSFAIPIGQALAIAHQIMSGQASSTIHLGLPPFLGVQVTTGANVSGRVGALVGSVVAGGPAAGAGVTPGAVIIAIDGQAIDSAPTLNSVLRQFHPGDTVTLNWIGAAGASHSARVVLGTGPAD